MSREGRILIIGASGFLGLHVAGALRAAGRSVVGLGPTAVGAPFDTFVVGRSELTGLLDQALEGVDAVIYLGGTSRPAVGMTRISDEIMREANHVLDVAELCAAKGTRRFVFASSGGTVYGVTDGRPVPENAPLDPTNAYGLSKVVAEQGLRLVARRTGLEVVSLRLSNPYGPGQRVKAGQGFVAAACQALTAGAPLTIWGDGGAVRDFVYVEDAAQAFACALAPHAPTGSYNIGSCEGHSLIEICRVIEEVAGRPLTLKFEPGRAVDVPRIVLSTDKAREELKWVATTDLRTGIYRTVEWWSTLSSLV